jgi:dipeptidyl aminopeptidase/acylaminoacyl peptidase
LSNVSRIAALTIVLSVGSTGLHAAPQPIEHFARTPQIRNVTISPDGRRIAFISGIDDTSVVMTLDRRGSDSAFRQIAASEPGKFDLTWCRWANHARLLCGLRGNIRGKKYAEPPYTRLIGVDADGRNLKVLQLRSERANMFVTTTSMQNFRPNEGTVIDGNSTRIDNVRDASTVGSTNTDSNSGRAGSASYMADRQDGVIDMRAETPDSVLIQIDDDGDSYPSVFALNILTGNMGVRLNETLPIRHYITDGRGNPRIGWGGTVGSPETQYFARLDGDREWRKLGSANSFSTNNPLRPVAMAADDNTAYALGSYDERDALWAIDLADKAAPKLLFSHPLVDVAEPILQTDRRLLGMRYDVERPYVWYADPKLLELMERIDKQFPGRVHEIVDSSEDLSVLVIRASSDVDDGTYYVFDKATDKLQKLGVSYPELDQKSLGTMTNILYKVTDSGTEVPGYLTVPNGVEKKNLPMVVLPHDGPLERDSWQFNYLRTFLANRGYAVLQMNYRGSAGFGENWRLAGHQDWGGVSYNDIQDATRWAVKEGIADPKRICIMGTGFGGYAALLGAARNGDLYRCSVSIAGVSDLELQREHALIHADAAWRREQIGSDSAKLRANSPITSAATIATPILMIHGDRDWEVQVDQTQAMAKALSRGKKPHKTVIIKAANHEMERKSDRETLLREIEAFLLENLGPGAQGARSTS